MCRRSLLLTFCETYAVSALSYYPAYLSLALPNVAVYDCVYHLWFDYLLQPDSRPRSPCLLQQATSELGLGHRNRMLQSLAAWEGSVMLLTATEHAENRKYSVAWGEREHRERS